VNKHPATFSRTRESLVSALIIRNFAAEGGPFQELVIGGQIAASGVGQGRAVARGPVDRKL